MAQKLEQYEVTDAMTLEVYKMLYETSEQLVATSPADANHSILAYNLALLEAEADRRIALNRK